MENWWEKSSAPVLLEPEPEPELEPEEDQNWWAKSSAPLVEEKPLPTEVAEPEGDSNWWTKSSRPVREGQVELETEEVPLESGYTPSDLVKPEYLNRVDKFL